MHCAAIVEQSGTIHLGAMMALGVGQQGEARTSKAAPCPAFLLSQYHFEVMLSFFVMAALSLFNVVS